MRACAIRIRCAQVARAQIRFMAELVPWYAALARKLCTWEGPGESPIAFTATSSPSLAFQTDP